MAGSSVDVTVLPLLSGGPAAEFAPRARKPFLCAPSWSVGLRE
jgi:hypothetical protein